MLLPEEHLARGDYQSVLMELERGSQSLDTQELLVLVRCLVDLGETEKAEKVVRSFAPRRDQLAKFKLAQARLAHAQGLPQDAAQAIEEAYSLESQDLEINSVRLQLATHTRSQRSAKESLTVLMRDGLQDAASMLAVAQFADSVARQAHAVDFASRSVNLEPQFQQGYLTLYSIYLRAGDKMRREDAIQSAAALAENHLVLISQSWLLLQRGDFEAAWEGSLRARRYAPKSREVLSHGAYVAFVAGRSEQAKEWAAEAISRNALAIAATDLTSAAGVLLALGEHAAARRVLRDLVKECPVHKPAQQLLMCETPVVLRPFFAFPIAMRAVFQLRRDAEMQDAFGRLLDSYALAH